jgi:pectate lyase
MGKKNMVTMVVVALVFAGAGFFGGMKYAQGKGRPNQGAFRGGSGNVAGRRTGAGGGPAGGFTGGQIISKDDKSITIKTMDGGSKIVFLGASTQIAKSASGTLTDLTNGENVTVVGSANSDGSLTAQMIQIRPAGQTPPAR